jgi:NAD(P)-dependent dehydrogenase (short-subunit alcohol dehydrogenase family)
LGGGLLDYGTSKAALIRRTKNVVLELGCDGIGVNGPAPGGVVTEAAVASVGGDVAIMEERAKANHLIGSAILWTGKALFSISLGP